MFLVEPLAARPPGRHFIPVGQGYIFEATPCCCRSAPSFDACISSALVLALCCPASQVVELQRIRFHDWFCSAVKQFDACYGRVPIFCLPRFLAKGSSTAPLLIFVLECRQKTRNRMEKARVLAQQTKTKQNARLKRNSGDFCVKKYRYHSGKRFAERRYLTSVAHAKGAIDSRRVTFEPLFSPWVQRHSRE